MSERVLNHEKPTKEVFTGFVEAHSYEPGLRWAVHDDDQLVPFNTVMFYKASRVLENDPSKYTHYVDSFHIRFDAGGIGGMEVFYVDKNDKYFFSLNPYNIPREEDPEIDENYAAGVIEKLTSLEQAGAIQLIDESK